MNDFAKIIGGGFLVIVGIFLFVIFGALAGWIVGLFFADTILGILSQLGINNITMSQFGAFMGFIGGFMKTTVTTKE